jgi:DNA-binding CsgD family transcriptional regulator
VGPKQGDYARAQRRLESVLERGADSADAVVETFLTTLTDLLGIDSSCWHHTDPASGSPVSWSAFGDAPGSIEEAMQYEFERPDVNRFREMIEPSDVRDELRISVRDAFGTWAAVVAFTRREITDADARFVSDVTPTVAAALRRSAASQWRAAAGDPAAQDDAPGPSVLILDGDDHIVASDATARRRLELLPDHQPGQVPAVISYLAARARWDGADGPAAARMRIADGRWFLLDASAMDDAPGNVAVVLQPASPSSVLTHVLRSYGLSAREREVAALLAHGHSAKSIAARLTISPWTAQDHVKAIYRKTGVGARSDLGALAGAASA